ncbi:hypothetical protein J7I97_36375 [Streptomyces sp. ISL-87]|uniref:hypothetical protein n=1 Tax=Streptomyces sp. ISL-87 TaxID=2819188 RepID=UPI001BE8CB93|nr:hypothetical protein [Streptomyces sp. ISL-87]MBT2613545.1 hypothetical protein [Streptomyces sp. ISL-87]
MSEDARRLLGPLSEGLDVPKDLDLELNGRNKTLHQLGVRPDAHARIVSVAKHVLDDQFQGVPAVTRARVFKIVV